MTQVTATDVDLPAQTLTYDIVPTASGGGADAARFTINASGNLSFVATPNFEAPVDANGDNIYEVTVRVSDGSGGVDTQLISVTVTDVSTVSGVAAGTLMFTTKGGQTLASDGTTWTAGQVLQYGNAGDYFDINGGTTTGTVDILAGFGAPVTVRGVHYVQSAITIGTTGAQFTLNPGDLLLVLDPASGSVALNAGDGNLANDFSADRQDIVVYRPATLGNYASGEYFMLLDNGVQNGGTSYNVHALSLVETDTMVGGTLLTAGTFIVAHSNTSLHYNIYTFSATGTGNGAATQTSNTSLLLNGSALSTSTSQIQGLHLLTQATAFNDTALAKGTLLVAVNGSNASYAGVPQDTFDIVALSITKTQQDASPGTVATGQMLFDGSDLGLTTTASINLNGFTVVTNAASNSAPVVSATGTALAYTENQAAKVIDSGLIVTDDSGNLTGATVTISANYASAQDVLAFTNQLGITGSWNATTGVLTLSGSTTVSNYQTALRSVTYFNSSDDPSPLARTVSFVVNDGTALSAAASKTINVTPVNDAPVVATTGTPLAYSESQAASVLDAGLTVSDVDNANLTGATVSLSANYANGQDVLAFTNQLGITGSWNAGTGVLTLSGTTTLANYQTALRTVTYFNTSENPSTLARTVAFVVNDGALLSTAATKTITVTSVNDAPVITSNGAGASASVAIPENTSYVTQVTATDVDLPAQTLTYDIVPTASGGGADAARFTIDAGNWRLAFRFAAQLRDTG